MRAWISFGRSDRGGGEQGIGFHRRTDEFLFWFVCGLVSRLLCWLFDDGLFSWFGGGRGLLGVLRVVGLVAGVNGEGGARRFVDKLCVDELVLVTGIIEGVGEIGLGAGFAVIAFGIEQDRIRLADLAEIGAGDAEPLAVLGAQHPDGVRRFFCNYKELAHPQLLTPVSFIDPP